MNKTSLIKYCGVVLLLSVVLTIAAGCQPDVENTSKENEVITILQGVDATTLDPAMHSDSPTGNVEYQIFDTLLERSNDMRILPCVASSWEMVNDTTWQFELRDDVYFHDGVQLTAADVKYSVDRILDPANESARISNYSSIKSVTVNDDFSLTIITNEPTPVLLSRLAELRIVPEHYVSEVGNGEFSINPVGSGPYVFNEWVKDEYIGLVANEAYWRGVPDIKKIIFKPVPEASARVMALQTGEADIITNLPPHQVEELNQGSGVGVAKADSTRFIMLSITTSRPAVSDVRIRKALNYAIDVEGIITNILGGNATLSTQPVCNFDLGYNPDIEPYGYDPEKARQLLAEAGKADGLKLVMQSPSGRYLMDKEVAEAIKAQLEAVGITVELSFEEWGNYVTSIIKGTIEADIWLIGWGSSTFDAGTTLYNFLHTNQPVAQYDIDEETNSWVDETLEAALATMNNEEREAMYHQVIEQVYDDAAFANLYQQVDLYGVSERIDWQPRSDEIIIVRSISWK